MRVNSDNLGFLGQKKAENKAVKPSGEKQNDKEDKVEEKPFTKQVKAAPSMFGNMKVKAKQVLNESDVAEDDNALNKTTFGASKDNSFSATEDRQNKSFNAPQKKAAEKTTTDQGSNEAKKGNALNFMA